MAVNTQAYAMIMWNRFNEDGTVEFLTTNIGFDEPAFDELESLGIITVINKFIGKVLFNPERAREYLKIS